MICRIRKKEGVFRYYMNMQYLKTPSSRFIS